MKLRIVTEREFSEKDWPFYVAAMKQIGSALTDDQYETLKKTGKLVIDHRNVDNAITIYEITKRG